MATDVQLRLDVIDAQSDAVWLLQCGFLVVAMQIGFSAIEAGVVQPKNLTNIVMKNFTDLAISGVAFSTIGWGFANGTSAAGIIGTDQFFLVGVSDSALLFFQFSFAATAATIVSGAMTERASYAGYCVLSIILGGIVYPIAAHWVWGSDGWLRRLGYLDFAGASVVHMLGGTAALVGSCMLGPRRGTFLRVRDDNPIGGKEYSLRPLPIPVTSIPISMMGTMVLWWGWYGFNCGSTLRISGSYHLLVSHVAVTTTAAASCGVVTAILLGYLVCGNASPEYVMVGTLSALVSITGCANLVSAASAMLIGAVGSAGGIHFSSVLAKHGVDDPVGAIAVHLGGGLWSMLLTALFVRPDPFVSLSSARGLLYGGPITLLLIQLAGILAICAWTVAVTVGSLLLLHRVGLLRVSAEDEVLGLDYTEHNLVREEYLLRLGVFLKHPERREELVEAMGSSRSPQVSLKSQINTSNVLLAWNRQQIRTQKPLISVFDEFGGCLDVNEEAPDSATRVKVNRDPLSLLLGDVEKAQRQRMYASVARPGGNKFDLSTRLGASHRLHWGPQRRSLVQKLSRYRPGSRSSSRRHSFSSQDPGHIRSPTTSRSGLSGNSNAARRGVSAPRRNSISGASQTAHGVAGSRSSIAPSQSVSRISNTPSLATSRGNISVSCRAPLSLTVSRDDADFDADVDISEHGEQQSSEQEAGHGAEACSPADVSEQG